MSNKDIAIELFMQLSKKNTDVINELCHKNLQVYTSGQSGSYTVGEIIEYITAFHHAFSDYTFTIKDIIDAGDKIALRCLNDGIHTGEWVGISATHKKISYEEMIIMHFVEHEVSKVWIQNDDLLMMQQIGGI